MAATRANVTAIGPSGVANLGIGLIIAFVVIGVLLALVLTALVARVIIAVIVVVLALVVWQQRSKIENDINEHACNLGTTFFGVHVDPPDSVRQACISRAQTH